MKETNIGKLDVSAFVSYGDIMFSYCTYSLPKKIQNFNVQNVRSYHDGWCNSHVGLMGAKPHSRTRLDYSYV